MSELGEQIDSINKMKAKAEKDKGNMERDLQDNRSALEEAMRERANIEKNGKMTQGLIVEGNQKLDELARALNESEASKKKLNVENQDLQRQIEDTENSIAQLGKQKISLTTQLEDTKRLADAAEMFEHGNYRRRKRKIKTFEELANVSSRPLQLASQEPPPHQLYPKNLSLTKSTTVPETNSFTNSETKADLRHYHPFSIERLVGSK